MVVLLVFQSSLGSALEFRHQVRHHLKVSFGPRPVCGAGSPFGCSTAFTKPFQSLRSSEFTGNAGSLYLPTSFETSVVHVGVHSWIVIDKNWSADMSSQPWIRLFGRNDRYAVKTSHRAK